MPKMLRPRKPRLKPIDLFCEQLAAVGLEHVFEREYRFSPAIPTWRHVSKLGGKRRWHFEQTRKPRLWRFDLANAYYKICIEVDGGNFIRGGHARGAQMTSDYLKSAYAALSGWLLIRVDSTMVRSGVALDLVRQALKGVEIDAASANSQT